MDVQHKRRTGEDRREYIIYYRYGHERRNNSGNRRLETVEELQPYFTGNVSPGYGGADKRIEMIQKVADAFGVHPDSLELVERDELLNTTEICQSCEDQATINAELKAELAEIRKTVERSRNQARDLPLSFNGNRH